ncbi:unnamed protein product, partial [Amoebophrya sp. A25]
PSTTRRRLVRQSGISADGSQLSSRGRTRSNRPKSCRPRAKRKDSPGGNFYRNPFPYSFGSSNHSYL